MNSGKAPRSPGQFDRGQIGAVAHELGILRAIVARLGGVVAQAEHDQRVAQAGEAQAHAALGLRLGVLLRERPVGDLEHVVEHADGDGPPAETGLGRTRPCRRRVLDEEREVDRAQAAAAVGRQRLFGAGVGGLDGLAVVQVVVRVHAVEEQDARLGVVVGRAHDLVPQLAPRTLRYPTAVVALVGAGSLTLFGWARPCAPAPRRRRPRPPA